jgi:hypothetical protein
MSAETNLAARIITLREALVRQDPKQLAARAGASYTEISLSPGSTGQTRGNLHLSVWGREVEVAFPTLQAIWMETGQPLGLLEQGLLAYYFTLTDGTQPENRWIAFSELPDGRFYSRAFEGYTGTPLANTFQGDLDSFCLAAQAIGGQPEALGDAAFVFQALPRVSVLAVAWAGDEDFPTQYQILFDASAPHHLPTDGCAILGSALVRRLVKARSLQPDE